MIPNLEREWVAAHSRRGGGRQRPRTGTRITGSMPWGGVHFPVFKIAGRQGDGRQEGPPTGKVRVRAQNGLR
jgi:hypothetical protein